MGAPWQPWAAQADPIHCLELDLVWQVGTVGGRGGLPYPAPFTCLELAEAHLLMWQRHPGHFCSAGVLLDLAVSCSWWC